MSRAGWRVWGLWAAWLALGAGGAPAQAPMPPELPVVREIEVVHVGPRTVNRSVVLANVQTTVGQRISLQTLEQDVRDLINTGFFFDVRVLQQPVADGVKVIYEVEGKARVKEILFEGHSFYKEPRLRRDLTTKVGDVFDERKAHLDARKIVEGYHKAGFPDTTVVPESTVDADTRQAIVRFKVTEGDRVFLKRIEFEGLKAFPADRLRKLMKVRYRWFFSWLSGTGVMKDDQFREDLETLKDHYRSNGYLDMRIEETRVERVGRKWMAVTIRIFEGQQYKVGRVVIENTTLFPLADIEKQLRMTVDETFTPGGLVNDIRAIEDFYGARGYLDTQVRSRREANVETGRIDLVYTVREGDLNYIERINIRGNTKTKDKVIRRELAVAPGQVYNTVRVERSAERLRNLGYFSKVETTPHVTEVASRKDLVITVEEQRTGSMTFGAGFSSVDNLIGFIEVTQGNFDLFNWPTFTGAGQKMRARIQLGFERQDYILSFTEPWFLDQRLALGVDLFHRTSSFLSSDFEETRTGGALRLEKALGEFLRGQIAYSAQRIKLDVDNSASAEMQSQEGTDIRSAVEVGLTYDTRDSVFLTTRGNRTELTAELVGGPFGGDVSVYKLNAKTSFYFSFFNRHVLQIVGAAGVVDAFGASRGDGKYVVEPSNGRRVKVNDVPIYDRYFLGGPNNLRGFDFRDVSPKDVNNEPVGGNTFAHGTAEYSFPIVERIRGAFFYDVGGVWLNAYQFDVNEIRSDVGIGVRLNLPIGPLRLDYGYPITTQSGDSKSGKIQFSVGYQF